jgi:hypothetical protein
MDIRGIREQLAENGPDGIIGYARLPGAIADFPLYIVGDPTVVDIHATYGAGRMLELPVTIVVGRTVEDDGTGDLDDWLSTLPASLEAVSAGGLWSGKPLAQPTIGGYADWLIQTDKGPRTVGLAATVTFRLTPT